MNEQKKYLSKAIIYLAGGLDDPKLNLEKDCRAWRNQVVNLSKEKGMDIIYLDPTKKLSNLVGEVEDDHKVLIKLQQEGNFKELREQMKKITKVDLRQVDLCDGLIIHVNTDIHLCGSYHEVVNAVNQKKPVFIIAKNGVKKLPRWLFSLVHYDNMYNSVEECIEYLSKLNTGQIKLNEKWILIRKELHKLSGENL